MSATAGALLGLDRSPAVVAVVGCGGKTTLIEGLAREFGHKRVLLSPTTHILPPRGDDVTLCTTLSDCLAHTPARGIQCLGILNGTTGKLEALPPEVLCRLSAQYDLVLLEADGSRGLPCKGWHADEPVVPSYCTHTVGVVTLNALGKPADERSVLRLPEFLRLTGLQAGELITGQALTAMVCAGDGMFRRSAGRRSLFVNQIENSHCAAIAAQWLEELKRVCPDGFACCAYGSARANIWERV